MQVHRRYLVELMQQWTRLKEDEAEYDLTFPHDYSLQVVDSFRKYGVDFEPHVLPCGHYTTGETPFKFMDGWQIVSFLRTAFDSI